MIPNLEAFCLEFIAMVDIEKVLYFHGLMSMGESKHFTSQGSSVKSQKTFGKSEICLGFVINNLPCQGIGEWRRECSFFAILLYPAVKTREPLG